MIYQIHLANQACYKKKKVPGILNIFGEIKSLWQRGFVFMDILYIRSDYLKKNFRLTEHFVRQSIRKKLCAGCAEALYLILLHRLHSELHR